MCASALLQCERDLCVADCDRSYENPGLTATSRAIIVDIRALVCQLSAIDVPRPIALVCTLLRLQLLCTGFLAASARR